jgi:hypothetical protein
MFVSILHVPRTYNQNMKILGTMFSHGADPEESSTTLPSERNALQLLHVPGHTSQRALRLLNEHSRSV